ncbi:MAG: MOSC domain-containing protein [Chloroflexota bacterium]
MQIYQQGKVVAVSSSKKGGIPKNPKDYIEIFNLGVRDDYHSGEINFHANKNNPNRQISVVANEVIEDINSQIGEKIFPGSLGENILVEGLGDLSHIASGDILKIGKSVTLRVTDQNEPCVTLNSIDNRILKLIVGRRGLVASVESTGYIYPNDKVKLIPKKENV